MPQQGKQKVNDSLFSLELVVEKVYIPHTACRFPAVAFRLLDYPTIVIKHVEDDLAKALRKKISFDPYYELPDQFAELKDRHDNFMINKGKSCLFRMQLDILKQHLANTPLYVMIIDLFPEVPKLIGNSSVPLNTLIDLINSDIIKLGSTMPSVHGNKGLFKLYNLMGVEIGYFVLGFRLLCLGPSLIPHLPESVFLQRNSKSSTADKNVDRMIQKHQSQVEETNISSEPEIQVRSSACMTDPIKHDVLLQTVDMDDKAIDAALSGFVTQIETKPVDDKQLNSTSTQTDRRKCLKETHNNQRKWTKMVRDVTPDNDDIFINNIDCPPPLFYNSKALPVLEIQTHRLYQDFDNILVDDLSDLHSYDGQGFDKYDNSIDEAKKQDYFIGKSAVHFKPELVYKSQASSIRQARVGETVQGLQIAPNSDTIFPLLTALIRELSFIQNPELLLNVSNRIQAASSAVKQSHHSPKKEISKDITKNDKLSPSVVSSVAAALTKKLENSNDINKVPLTEKPAVKSQITHPSSHLGKAVESKKESQKQKTRPPKKLVYGITNTQRLRLQKANPQWLKAVEKEVASIKMKKPLAKKQSDMDNLNPAEFSDTLTEVRRLAEKELINTAANGDTLSGAAKEVEASSRLIAKQKSGERASVSREQSIERDEQKTKPAVSPVKSTSNRSLQNAPSPKRRLNLQKSKQNEQVTTSVQSDHQVIRKPVPHVRHSLTSVSSHTDQEANQKGSNYQSSNDLTSQSHSVEYRLPSPDLAESDIDIPLPDDSVKDGKPLSINLQKYISRDISLPESISGTANTSHNMSALLDDNSPLESTRYSKNFTPDKDSKHYLSTDYDTRQFQSTDEQELQDLLSEDENPSTGNNSGRRSVASLRASQKFPVINPQLSENSPVPSVRRSTQKLDPSTLGYVPSFSPRVDLSSSQRIEVSSSSTSITPKSNLTITKDFKPRKPYPNEFDSNQLDLKKQFYNKDMTEASNSSNSPSTSENITKMFDKPKEGSLHTDSLSTYMPSDPDNLKISSMSGIYSDDFHLQDIEANERASVSSDKLPKVIPSSKLGYTIN